MQVRKLIQISSKILMLILLFDSLLANAFQKKDNFPLAKGNYWIYQGIVKAAQPNSGKVLEKRLTWKMEVKDVITKNQITIAFLKGHPSDLVWYEEGRKRGEHLIVSINDKKFYMVDGLERKKEFLTKFNLDSREAILSLDDQWDLFLAFPLNSQEFCGGWQPTPDLANVLGRCYVEDKENVRLNIQGLTNQKFYSYHIAQRDNTGHTFINFVPDVGITEYIFGHHGTISQVDMKLVEFHQARVKRSP